MDLTPSQRHASAAACLADLIHKLERKHGMFDLRISFVELINLISQVQLALKHPANKGQPAKLATGLLNAIIDRLGRSEPKVADLLRLGFHEQAGLPEPSPGGEPG